MKASRIGRERGLARDRGGVSPIIGTVLIIFIVLVATAGILIWGVPTITGLQQHAEFRSVVSQMVQLDLDIQQLRDPKSSDTDSIGFNRGSLGVVPGGRWVVIGVTDAAYTGVTLAGWESDAATTVTISGMPGGLTVVTKYNGAVGTDAACVGSPATSCPLPGTEADRITRYAYRIRTTDGTAVKLDAWIINAGRIEYIQDLGSEYNRVYIEMGSVITRQGDALYMEQAPLVKDPTFTAVPPDTQFFVRLLELQGTTGSGGKGRFPVHVSLLENYGSSAGRPFMDNAVSVRFQIDDDDFLEEAFCNHLDARTDYVAASACDGNSVNVLYDPAGAQTFVYELNHGVVTATVRPF